MPKPRPAMHLSITRCRQWLYCLSLLSFLHPGAFAQSPITVKVSAVNLLVTVRDKHRKLINNLTEEDFLLDQDGRPQTISYFVKESDLPLTLGLLVDTSLSQRNVLGQELTASYHFLERVLREDKDQAFVIHFD